MSSTGVAHADVVAVGAGPTGLMLAGDLAEAGVRVGRGDELGARR
jgi:NADPH-dependent 2,4-dienoyl-CoA reductase/sulfur reductase-like enzyme